MTPKMCLRCDWEGTAGTVACPTCGVEPLFIDRPRHEAPVSPANPRRAEVDRVASPTVERRRSAWASLRTTAAAAGGLITVVLLIASAIPSEGDPSASRAPGAADREAVAVATAFLERYGALDAEGALAFLADDARFSLLIRSVGADGVSGTRREFRLFFDLLDAWRYRQEVSACTATASLANGTGVRCDFEYDFLGSDVLGLGPYTGSSFDITVKDGDVVFVSKFWAFDRFAREVWDPFADWVSAEHPNDARWMYDDPDRRGVQLDVRSIRRWERRTGGYLFMHQEASLIGDLRLTDPNRHAERTGPMPP